MKDPNIKTRVVHSQSKSAYNVVGTNPGAKFKIARVPYFELKTDDPFVNDFNKDEAFLHAEFISFCFNNSKEIIQKLNPEHFPPAK